MARRGVFAALALAALAALATLASPAAAAEGECEVCVAVVDKIKDGMEKKQRSKVRGEAARQGGWGGRRATGCIHTPVYVRVCLVGRSHAAPRVRVCAHARASARQHSSDRADTRASPARTGQGRGGGVRDVRLGLGSETCGAARAWRLCEGGWSAREGVSRLRGSHAAPRCAVPRATVRGRSRSRHGTGRQKLGNTRQG